MDGKVEKHDQYDIEETAPADMADVAKETAKHSDELLTTMDVLRKIMPAAAGSFVEFYEFAIFSYMSTEITDNFFANGHGGSLGTWAGFAITFAFRPIGGFVFGWIGDRFGRKPAMSLTIGLMLGTTFLQGFLPTFYCCGEGWGWFGLWAMLICRALQGMSAGGELSTAAVYITEVSPKKNLGWNLSWLSVTGCFGAWVIAALVVSICETVMSKEAMLLWGWRIPYFSSIIPGLAVVVGRRSLEETPEFEENKASSKSSSEAAAVLDLFANHKLALLVGSLGTAIFGALAFVPPMYGIKFIREYNDVPENVLTLSELISYLIPAVAAPMVGLMIDRYGAWKIFTLSIVLGGVISPAPLLYWWAHTPQGQAVASVFIGQALLGISLCLMTATYLWIVELFPVHVRVTGVSVAYNLGVGIFGGAGPLISDAGNVLIDPKGLLSAPAIYTTVIGIMSLSAVVLSRVWSKRGLMRLTHIRDTPY